jgi:hypothetical protein
MKKELLLVFILFFVVKSALPQVNKEVIFDFDDSSADLLDFRSTHIICNVNQDGIAFNFDNPNVPTPGSVGYLNFLYDNSSSDFNYFHFYKNFTSNPINWSPYELEASILFWINTNDGDSVSLCFGWNQVDNSGVYWGRDIVTINTGGIWKKYSVKLSDILWKDNYGTGATTNPDLTVTPKSLTIGFNSTLYQMPIGEIDFSVDNIAIVNIDALAVDAGIDKNIICGDSAQLSVSDNYSGSGTLTYLWSPAEGLSANDIPNPLASATSNKTYTVLVTSSNGGTATDSVSINVTPLTVAIEDVSVPCGGSGQLEVISNYNGTGNLNYNWNPSYGLDATNIPNPVVTLTEQTEYSVEITTPNGCTATDNIILTPSVTSLVPSICMVTVNENDKNEIIWQRPISSAIDSFFVYRESTTLSDTYDIIGKLPYSATGIFIDTTSNARVQSNKYKIAVKDVCGFETNKSNGHKTMHLTINKGVGNNWNLIWDQYIGVSVSNYNIYRGTSKTDLTLIGSTAGGNFTYTDETAPAGIVYYQIEVVLPQACINLKSTDYTSARSNIINNTDVNISSTKFITESFIYPNPVNEKLYFIRNNSNTVFVSICDLQGRIILNKLVNSDPLDVSELSIGTYLIKLVDSENIYINKLIKE